LAVPAVEIFALIAFIFLSALVFTVGLLLSVSVRGELIEN